MFERKSLKLPITLGVTMIILIVALIVGWVLLTTFQAMQSPESAFYWTLLSVGSVLFALVLVGVVIYLTLSIKAVNLTRRQSNFIDSVTHELKSPIASLKLYLQTLDKREVSEEERRKFHKFMMDDVERLDTLINHVLDAGYIKRNDDLSLVESIDLSALLSQCAQIVALRYRIEPETIKLDLEPCRIKSERIDLVMIFRNLIDNAVKYAGDPVHVKVHLRMGNNTAVVRIEDNGPGIPKDLRTKVFARFVRMGSELQREKPGTGLGLHIVKTLLKRVNGKIKILDVVGQESGTVFEVRLPGAFRVSKSAETDNVTPLEPNSPANPIAPTA
jgi:signal transduction histidine kinase